MELLGASIKNLQNTARNINSTEKHLGSPGCFFVDKNSIASYTRIVNIPVTVNDIRRVLQSEGYEDVYDWYDSPEFEYHDHAHQGDSAIWVMSGSMDIGLPDEHIRLTAGQRYTIPATIIHNALMGPEGCQYVTGETKSHES